MNRLPAVVTLAVVGRGGPNVLRADPHTVRSDGTFIGSPALDRVLRAEGAYDDFHRSGMTDLKAFVLQDLFGAGPFHPLAGLLLATACGSIGAALALTVRRRRSIAPE